MPRFMVEFSKSFDISVEANSVEELEKAIKNEDFDTWELPEVKWEYSIFQVPSQSLTKDSCDPEFGISNGEIEDWNYCQKEPKK